VSHITDPLRVYECDLPMLRVGGDNDGGYVMAGGLEYGGFLSGGICGDNRFERAILELYPSLRCYAFDPSNDRGAPHDRYVFNDARVPTVGNRTKDNIVKLDIEGDEWPWLEVSDLGRVAQLVIELHSPHLGRWSWPTLARLAETHALIHAHGNNWDGIVDIEGVRVPGTLETTWVRRDLAGPLRPNTQPIPGPLDMPNVAGRPDHMIDWAPFVWGTR
jgi:hypothetical protein